MVSQNLLYPASKKQDIESFWNIVGNMVEMYISFRDQQNGFGLQMGIVGINKLY